MKRTYTPIISLVPLLLISSFSLQAQEDAKLPSDQPPTASTPIETAPPATAPQVEVNSNAEKPTAEAAAAKAAQYEEVHRREMIFTANQAIADGDRLRSSKEWDKALERYQYALKILSPDGASKGSYSKAAAGAAAVKDEQGEEALKNGDREKAIQLFQEAVSFQPKNGRYSSHLDDAKEEQEAFDAKRRQPASLENNPAVTPQFIDKVAQVQKLFFEGDRFFETDQFDKANERYSQVLAIDPYNKAARAKLEKLEKYEFKKAQASHEQSRAEAMYQITKRWSEAVPSDFAKKSVVKETGNPTNIAALTKKLEDIRIPKLSFNQTEVADVVQFLQAQSRELDPEHQGVNFVYRPDPLIAPAPAASGPSSSTSATGTDATAPLASSAPKPVSMNLTNPSLMEVLRVLTSFTTLKFKVEENAVLILPATDTGDLLITRTFAVPPGFFTTALAIRPSTTGTREVSTAESVKVDVQKQLKDLGVEFPPGAVAAFLPSSSKLVVKNTPEQIDVIDALISQRQQEEPQIEIETKFAEFTEDQLKELSFNYVLGANASIPQIGLPSVSQISTTGYSAATALRNEQTTGQNPIGGLSANNLDVLISQNQVSGSSINVLNGSALIPNTPNTITVGGLIENRGLAAFINLIDQMKGVDLLSAPKITTKSRNQAKIEIVNELRYPTQFEKPKIGQTQYTVDKQETLVTGGTVVIVGTTGYLALPATPSNFEVKNIGVTMEVTPTAYPDRRIDLDITPEVTDFEGFLNYGQPIRSRSTTADPTAEGTAIADSVVNQPVFNVRSMTTKVQVIDGQTIVMGGLIREDSQKVNDKVPLLGDIPLVGRLFQSKVDKTIKRNLMIFVTARLVKSNGKPQYSRQVDEIPHEDSVVHYQPPAGPVTTVPASASPTYEK